VLLLVKVAWSDDDDDDDDDDINLRPGGASGTDIPRPPKGYRDVLS
jgi:hypothetical protein